MLVHPRTFPPVVRPRHLLAAALLALSLAGCAESPTHPATEPAAEPTLLVLGDVPGGSYQISHARPDRVQAGVPEASRTTRGASSGARRSLAATQDPMTFDGFYRQPAEAASGSWVYVADGGDAFFRDVSVSVENTLTAAADGDSWRVTVTHPNGTVEDGGLITFHSTYNGQQDCFVAGFSALCGSTQAYLSTYLNSKCAESGVWTARFAYNGTPHGQATFNLHPRIPDGAVPSYFQLDYATTAYDSACTAGNGSIKCTGAPGEVKRTILKKGCGLTSATMALGYFGVSGTPVDVNTFMTNNSGYQPGGNLLFPRFAAYAAQVDTTIIFSSSVGMTPAQLRTRICTYGPQILEVKSLSPHGNQHFVLAIGYSDDEKIVRIHDPANYTRTDLTAYGTWKSVRKVERPERKDTLAPGIIVSVHSPVHVLLTDPSGLQTGYDPSKGTLVAQIPAANYDTAAALSTIADDGSFVDDEPDAPKELDVDEAASGNYIVDVTGMATGTYILTIDGFGRGGSSSAARFWGVPITAGEVHSYRFNYDPTTAGTSGAAMQISGAFSGGGQRSAVDELLSYSRPGQRQTALPAGTTSYSIQVFYGPGLDAATFTATLNGADVRAMFHPIAGGNEVVAIPLVSGRNVLKLSSSGTVGGRTTTDQDQLVFKTP